jgi:peptide methionine sulfoxide reductase MsrA
MTLKVEYLSDVEAVFETAVGFESGDQESSIYEQLNVGKYRKTVPLNTDVLTPRKKTVV